MRKQSKKKTYKNFDNLEGKVNKVIRKTLGLGRRSNTPAAIISMNIWQRAYNELRSPTDSDISIGIYEYFGDTRQ